MIRLSEWMAGSETPRLDTGILLLLVVFCLFAPHSIAVTETAFYSALLLALIKIALARQRKYTASALDVPLFAFVALTGLSAVFSYEPTVSIKKLGSVSLCLIFFLVAQWVWTVRLARTLVLVMLISCLVNVGYVFWQKIHGHGLKIVQMRSDSPLAAIGLAPEDVILDVNGHSVGSLEEVYQLAGQARPAPVKLFIFRPEIYFRRELPMSHLQDPQSLGIEVTPWHGFRAAGFYGWNYFTYAEVLQLLASIAFGLLLQVRERRSWLFGSLALAVAAMSVALILTVTRAVWVAYAGALFATSLRAVHKRAVLIILIVGLAAAPLALKLLHQTRGQPMVSAQEPSTAYRLTVWAEGVNLLMSRPKHLLLGIGMDSLKYHWREWGLFQGGKLPVGHMHSTPLQIALERGIPALLCFSWWFSAYMLLLWRLTGAEGLSLDWISRGIGLGIFGGSIGFLLSSLVHYNFGDSEVVMIVYFLMGVSVVIEREVSHRPGAASSERRECATSHL